MDYFKDFTEGKRLFNLEDRLSASLKPVKPNPTFINSLRQKLAEGSNTVIEHRQDYMGFLALGLGLAAGALLIWVLRRMK